MKKKNETQTARIFVSTHRHEEDEMSRSEKGLLCMLMPESEPLDLPTRPLHMSKGPDTMEYVVPEDRREEFLKLLYPFIEVPDIDARLYDIHENKAFTVREYRVIRERNRNFIVSPYYPRSGGMVVDWMSCNFDDNGEEPVAEVQTVKGSGQCVSTVQFQGGEPK
jgi:hypothetical protein